MTTPPMWSDSSASLSRAMALATAISKVLMIMANHQRDPRLVLLWLTAKVLARCPRLSRRGQMTMLAKIDARRLSPTLLSEPRDMR